MTTPNNVKTEFSRQRDQQQVAQILQAGCTHMIKAFAIDDINIDDLIATAMDDPQAIGGAKVLRGINLDDLLTAYKQFCKGEKVAHSAVDLGEVIDVLQRGDGGPAGPHQAQESSASRLERRSGPQEQGVRRGVRREPASRLGSARANPAARAQRLHRRRGQALLPAQGDRRARPDPRLHQQSGAVSPARGRLDHHPAGRQEPAGRRGRHLRPQDPRDDRRGAARVHAHQG